VRLFVAFQLPARILEALAAWTAIHRPHLPAARWQRPEMSHLTLAFLGEIDATCRPRLEAELEAAFAGAPPVAVRLCDVGSFPARGAGARAIWIGVEADRELVALRDAVVGAALATAGAERRNTRPFAPHITLARCRPPWSAAAVARLRSAGRELPSAPFRLAEGTLFASDLRPTGAVHTPLAVFPLRSGA